MEQPKAGEYWHIRYGISDNNIIVLVLEDIEIKPPNINWTKYSFKCLYKDEKDPPPREMDVVGELFVEKLHTIGYSELIKIKQTYEIETNH